MEAQQSRKRRRYSAEQKAQILAGCEAPGASVAKVAMSHGINANIVHGWRKLARKQGTVRLAAAGAPTPVALPKSFVPLALPAVHASDARTDVQLEIKRGAVTVSVAWPEQALGELAGFVRELLK